MITCYQGTPGSGKSYDAVVKIINNLRLGRVVYSNIDGLDDEKCRHHIQLITGLDDYQMQIQLIYLSPVDAEKCFEVAKKGSLIVLDEAHKIINCRDWNSTVNRSFSDFASTHRHFGYDVLLLTQDIEKLDKAVRSLVEWVYHYRKTNFLGSLFTSTYTCHVLSGDGHGKPIKSFKRIYDKKYFQCYKSYVSQDTKELGIQKAVNILHHPIFYAIPVLLGVFIYMFAKSGFAKGEIIPGASKLKEKTSTAVAVAGSSVNPVTVTFTPIDVNAGVQSSRVNEVVFNYVIVALVNMSDDTQGGFVLYRPANMTMVRLRASRYDFDRLCACNSFARFRAGDFVTLKN